MRTYIKKLLGSFKIKSNDEEFWAQVRWGYQAIRALGKYPPFPSDAARKKSGRLNQPCAECGEKKGTFTENGFYRCNNCGFPGK